MDSLKDLSKNFNLKRPKSSKLHSANHVLADELSSKLNDSKHFAVYLKFAMKYNHSQLRKLCSEVLDLKSANTPGRLFSYLVKQQLGSDGKNSSTNPTSI